MKKILGFTESINMCGCCGKQNLKGTYAIEIDGGEIQYFGSTCAFKKFGYSEKELKNETKRIEHENYFIKLHGGSTYQEAKINRAKKCIDNCNWSIERYEEEMNNVSDKESYSGKLIIGNAQYHIREHKKQIEQYQEEINNLTIKNQ